MVEALKKKEKKMTEQQVAIIFLPNIVLMQIFLIQHLIYLYKHRNDPPLPRLLRDGINAIFEDNTND